MKTVKNTGLQSITIKDVNNNDVVFEPNVEVTTDDATAEQVLAIKITGVIVQFEEVIT